MLVSMDHTVQQLGEDGVLARILGQLQPGTHVVVGPGDDAAVSDLPGLTVATTDMLVENEDFVRAWLNPYKLGRKAAAQNLADLYAMGATPHGLLLSLAVPGDTPVSAVEDFTRGLSEEAQRASAAIIGGDLSSSATITVSITALGYLDGQPLTRCAAQPGDGVFLVGTVGHAAAGLDLLFAGRRLGEDPRLDPFIETQLGPRPDYHLAAQLPGWAHAAIDVSDGLSGDLGKIATKSHVDVTLDPAALAALADQLTPAAQALGKDPLHWVLHGGEDHGFVVTGPAASAPVGLMHIGECSAGTGRITLGGQTVQREAFTHFSTSGAGDRVQ